MPKQCPLKMAAIMTQQDQRNMYQLSEQGLCNCGEADCAWWSLENEQCAVTCITGAISDTMFELGGIINRK